MKNILSRMMFRTIVNIATALIKRAIACKSWIFLPEVFKMKIRRSSVY